MERFPVTIVWKNSIFLFSSKMESDFCLFERKLKKKIEKLSGKSNSLHIIDRVDEILDLTSVGTSQISARACVHKLKSVPS